MVELMIRLIHCKLCIGVEPTEWRKISAAWSVDEDISRLLKSLPNWTSLMQQQNNVLINGVFIIIIIVPVW
jgi:hypothetical protein